jgi:hypothetical protein
MALRLSQLKFYLRAVANAILDHKMHCSGMTDDEALRFLTEGAFQSEGEARLKIIRSKQSSVQTASGSCATRACSSRASRTGHARARCGSCWRPGA